MGVLGRVFMGGLGWALAGPIGGLLGWWLGSQLDGQGQLAGGTGSRGHRAATRPGDFAVALLVLIAKVLKADGRVLKAELEVVKQFLIQNFGRENAQEMMHLLRGLLEQDYHTYEVAGQINRHMNSAEKLELMHLLFRISQADGKISRGELSILKEIASHLHITSGDFDTIHAMFHRAERSAYQILEVDPSVSDTDLKKTYRNLATKYHPDKVQHLGEDFQKIAEEKFKAINEAYQEIKAERGI